MVTEAGQQVEPDTALARSAVTRHTRYFKAATGMVLTGLALYVGAKILLYPANGPKLWDDAYFFARYAENFLAHESFSWNPGQAPVYGNTSQTYQVLVTCVHALLGRNSVLTLTAASHLGGLLTTAGILLAFWIASPRRHPPTSWAVLLFGSVYLCCSSDLWGHYESGMDTTLAAAFVAFSGALYLHWEKGGLPAISVAVLPAVGILLYLTRPDLGVFSVILPAAIAISHPSAPSRRRAYKALGLTAIGLVVVLGMMQVYYGSPLPLSFYVKTLGITAYGKEFLARYSGIGQEQLVHWVKHNSPMLLLAAFGWRGFARLSATERGLLLAAILFCLYQLSFTLQIMPAYARFYFPCFPVLMLFGLRGLETQLDSIRVAGFPSMRSPGQALALAVVVAVGLLFASIIKWGPLGQSVVTTVDALAATRASQFGRMEALLYAFDKRRDYWFRLDRLSLETPNSCFFATSEIGLPGVLNPGRRVFDLSGLNEPTMLEQRFSAAYLLDMVRPDWLYLPHPHYVDWNAAILAHPTFDRDYDYYDPQFTRTTMGVALLKSSQCYAQMVRIVRDEP